MSDFPSSRPRGQQDPGWNDPPKLTFSSVQTSSKTRLNLNKRVAFPLQGGSSTTKPTAIVHPSHPPMPTPPVAVVPPMARTVDFPCLESHPTSTEACLGSEDMSNLPDAERLSCFVAFSNCISEIQPDVNIKPDEIKRRISMMNEMWASGSMSPTLQRRIQRIAKSLMEKNFEEAMENYRMLVADHSNSCMTWAAALRQVILAIQPKDGSEPIQHDGADLQALTTATNNRQMPIANFHEGSENTQAQSSLQQI